MLRSILLLLCLFGLTTFSFVAQERIGSGGLAKQDQPDPSSAIAFENWLAQNKLQARQSEFAKFEKFLADEGVDGVVPAWQLLRVDANYAARCNTGFFAMPPREKWKSVVPALRLLRDEVVAVTGPVAVVSAWRSPEVNSCINGASRSKHLEFSALDLVALQMSDRSVLFGDLCALHKRKGSQTRMGLGAYYDPDKLVRNERGRFHIDASGYRQWGFGYTSATSPCGRLLSS